VHRTGRETFAPPGSQDGDNSPGGLLQFCILLALTLFWGRCLSVGAQASATPPRWQGRWVGTLVDEPERPGAKAVGVMRGETIEEEILTVDDRPAISGVLPLIARSIQRITLHRDPPG
jgi:hypothetical protein